MFSRGAEHVGTGHAQRLNPVGRAVTERSPTHVRRRPDLEPAVVPAGRRRFQAGRHPEDAHGHHPHRRLGRGHDHPRRQRPLLGLVTFDGVAYAMHSTAGPKLAKGDHIRARLTPAKLRISCGDGIPVSMGAIQHFP